MIMKNQTARQSFIYRFAFRWLVCSLGLWIAAGLLGQHLSYNNDFWVIVWSGLLLAIVNVFLKPIIVILSLPAILLSLGLFMIVVNGFMVLIVSKITPLHVSSFWYAMLTGMIIGLVNFLVTTILENR